MEEDYTSCIGLSVCTALSIQVGREKTTPLEVETCVAVYTYSGENRNMLSAESLNCAYILTLKLPYS